MSDTFTVWKSGVLSQIGAPDNATNTDTLWAWQSAEGGIGHNNPLNTTFYMPGATPWNTLSDNLHVWIYATIADGITATVSTLLNGDYPRIVSHLQNSVPRQQWGDCCGELGTWGTGCGWISNDYGAAPGAATSEVEVLDPNDPIVKQIYADLALLIQQVGALYKINTSPTYATEDERTAAVLAAVEAAKPSVTVPTQISLTGSLHS